MTDNQGGVLSAEQFAQELIEALRRAGEEREIRYDAEQFQLHVSGGGFLNLSNMYRSFCDAAEEDRPKVLQTAVRSWCSQSFEMPQEFGDARPDIYPSVRSRSYFEFARLQAQVHGAGGGPEPPTKPLADHLAIGLVYDLPSAMRSITASDLEAWGISFYEALEAACENLAKMPFRVSQTETGVYIIATGDSYDASRLLLLDLFDFEFAGHPVAMVPNRELLLVTGSEDTEGLAMLAAIGEEALQQPRSISGRVVQSHDGDWSTWLPPSDHPSFQGLSKLVLKSDYQDYSEQKELFDAIAEREGSTSFTSTFSAVETKSGLFFSYCLWNEGSDLLLPQTDIIVFGRPSAPDEKGDRKVEIVASGSWQKVSAICGERLEPTDHYPMRYRARSFPTAAELVKIGHDPRLGGVR